MTYTIYIQYNPLDQEYIASAPELEGVSVKAKTQVLALLKVQQAIKYYVEHFPEHDTRPLDAD